MRLAAKIWEQFSSETYKRTPSVGRIDVYEPFTDRYVGFNAPGGGPGFYRVPTLVSLWNSTPYLHNNALGDYTGDPSVAGRMRAFDNAIDQMFWLEKRGGRQTIDRTPQKTWFVLPAVYLPDAVEGIAGRAVRPFTAMPWLLPAFVLLLGIWLVRVGMARSRWRRRMLVAVGSLLVVLALALAPLNYFAAGKLGDLRIGPFPKGMPIDVVANLNPAAPPLDMLSAMWQMHVATSRIEKENLSDAEALRVFNETAGPSAVEGEQESGLDRRPGPLLRRRVVGRRQAGAQGVSQDALSTALATFRWVAVHSSRARAGLAGAGLWKIID